METDLARITSNYFCAGLLFNQMRLVVVDTAPILSYMNGWQFKRVLEYCEKKGWKFEYCFSVGWKEFCL
jgi:hypothetical protein